MNLSKTHTLKCILNGIDVYQNDAIPQSFILVKDGGYYGTAVHKYGRDFYTDEPFDEGWIVETRPENPANDGAKGRGKTLEAAIENRSDWNFFS